MGVKENIKIYDKRYSKIVKTFEKADPKDNRIVLISRLLLCCSFFFSLSLFIWHLKLINWFKDNFTYCVQWNPEGDMLASISGDNILGLFDFKTGKIIFSQRLSTDYGKLTILVKFFNFRLTFRRHIFRVFYLVNFEALAGYIFRIFTTKKKKSVYFKSCHLTPITKIANHHFVANLW